ncbi:hypothetical protein B0H12DRAFT_1242876, partial [Mycena haematopus]
MSPQTLDPPTASHCDMFLFFWLLCLRRVEAAAMASCAVCFPFSPSQSLLRQNSRDNPLPSETVTVWTVSSAYFGRKCLLYRLILKVQEPQNPCYSIRSHILTLPILCGNFGVSSLRRLSRMWVRGVSYHPRLPQPPGYLKERGTCTSDVEVTGVLQKSADTTIARAESCDVFDRSIADTTLTIAHAKLPASIIIKVCLSTLLWYSPRSHLAVRDPRSHRCEPPPYLCSPLPSPQRFVCRDVKRAAATAVLVTAREHLLATLKKNLGSKVVVVVDIAKVLGDIAPRSLLVQLNQFE